MGASQERPAGHEKEFRLYSKTGEDSSRESHQPLHLGFHEKLQRCLDVEKREQGHILKKSRETRSSQS